ncbi:MAG TPA: DUF4190 domain-containing protein [Miltoncostaeaceae bacterium]|nr:DUF4190 domain-containing protein [Miltoncostaeaceae bacterium]
MPLTRQPLTTAGLLAGILAALLACLAPGRDLVSGPAREATAGVAAVELPVGVIAVFAIAAVLLGLALGLPARWPRIAGVAVLTALASTLALIVVIARVSDRFAVDADLSLETGGTILAIAFGVTLVGLVLALVGSRELAAPRPDRPPPPPGGSSGRATAALVLGITGLFASIAAALAVVFATMALADIRMSGGTRGGRGQAIAGLVLGIVWLTLWALFLVAGVFAASPSAD